MIEATAAGKVAAWRADHRERLTEPILVGLLGIDHLRGADLGGADLWGANLRGANLWDADMWGGMSISTPSGSGYLMPTPDGWRVTIGCWQNKTLDDLRALVETDADWPEATGAERDRRRPILAALLALCEAHAAYHADRLAAVVEKWGA